MKMDGNKLMGRKFVANLHAPGALTVKGMGALRHASLLCILMILLLSVALVVAGTKTIDVSEALDGPVQYWAHGRVGFMEQLPVLIFAYTCNMNVPIFYGSLVPFGPEGGIWGKKVLRDQK